MTKIPVTQKNGSQMDYLEAELDLASIEKLTYAMSYVDLRYFRRLRRTLNFLILIVTSMLPCNDCATGPTVTVGHARMSRWSATLRLPGKLRLHIALLGVLLVIIVISIVVSTIVIIVIYASVCNNAFQASYLLVSC